MGDYRTMQKIITAALSLGLSLVAIPVSAQISADTYVNSNVFRPDDRDRLTGGVVLRGEGLDNLTLTIESTTFANPSTQVVELGIDYQVTDELKLSVGADVTGDQVVPSAGAGWLVTESDDLSIYTSYSYGLLDNDPRAIQSDLRSHDVSLNFWANDVSGWGKAGFISDGNQVYEGGLSMATGEEWLSFTSYGRSAAESSDNYWSPSSFVAVGAELKTKLSDRCGAGIQLGVAINEGEVNPAYPVGAQCSFDWGMIGAGYAYGANLGINARIEF
jgi:hypothetical protein